VLSENDNFSFTGQCQPDGSKIEITFLNDWHLELYFYKESQTSFIFNHVVLYYKINGALFPNSLHQGAQSEVYETAFINSTTLKSYSCQTGLRIDLGEVVILMRDVRVEPHFNRRPNQNFDPNDYVMCEVDKSLPVKNTMRNIGVVMIVLAFFLPICCCCGLFVFLKARNSKKYQDDEKKKMGVYEKVTTTIRPSLPPINNDDDNETWWKRRV
jgi:hypothetical protein